MPKTRDTLILKPLVNEKSKTKGPMYNNFAITEMLEWHRISLISSLIL